MCFHTRYFNGTKAFNEIVQYIYVEDVKPQDIFTYYDGSGGDNARKLEDAKHLRTNSQNQLNHNIITCTK